MKRRLRIAVSVFFGVLTVLVCVLWVRSYWRVDMLVIPTTDNDPLLVESGRGTLECYLSGRPNEFRWLVFEIDKSFEGYQRDRKQALQQYSQYGLTRWRVHYRLPVVIGVTLAILPWIRWSSRFSLRALFIAMTLLAVLLVVWFSI